MNKVLLMGRLTRDPEIKYSQGDEPLAIARYTIAVNRRFKRDGEPDADFLRCVAFGKNGEFAEKYMHKGGMYAITGHLQTGSYEKDGITRYTTDVIIEEQHFAESKSNFESRQGGATKTNDEGFVPVDDDIDDDDVPF